MKKNLVLLGMMAVGKTTLGKIVAKKQDLKFIDIDASIEKKNSMTIKEIFKKKGEKFFRDLEEKEVLKIFKKKPLMCFFIFLRFEQDMETNFLDEHLITIVFKPTFYIKIYFGMKRHLKHAQCVWECSSQKMR